MLLNKEKTIYDFSDKKTSVELFAESKRRIDAKKEAIEDLKNELELLQRQAYNLYCSNVSYAYFGAEIIDAAKEWHRKTNIGEKIDKRKKCKEKISFQYLQDYISGLLGVECSIIGFVDFNFGQADEIKFKYADHEWMLEIPRKVGFKEYSYYGDSVFKLKLLYWKSTSVTELVGSTFEESELKDIMKLGINKIKEENNEN